MQIPEGSREDAKARRIPKSVVSSSLRAFVWTLPFLHKSSEFMQASAGVTRVAVGRSALLAILTVCEIIGINLLNLVGRHWVDAYSEINHQLRKRRPINQNDLRVDAGHEV